MSSLPSEAVEMVREQVLADTGFVQQIAQRAGLPTARDLETEAQARGDMEREQDEKLEALRLQIETLAQHVQALSSKLNNLPDATATQKGVTWFAGNGTATEGRAVQATDKRLAPATTTNDGLMSKADKTKLDTLPVTRADFITATTTGAGTAKITFSPAYSAPPIVEGSTVWSGQQQVVSFASNVTATGCDVTVMRTRGNVILSAGPFEAAPVGTAFRVLVLGR